MENTTNVKVGNLFKIKNVVGWDFYWNSTAGYIVKVVKIEDSFIYLQYINYSLLNTQTVDGLSYRWELAKIYINKGLQKTSHQLEFSFMYDKE